MIVYAIKENTTIWSDNNATHKAGRVPLHQPLRVKSDSNQSWYAIERPDNISLPPQSDYPDYWVKRSDVLLSIVTPDPEPEPDPVWFVSDQHLADAIVTIMKWFKQ